MLGKRRLRAALLATVVAVYNVYGDNSDVQENAEGWPAARRPCVRLLRAERTPIEQAFTFQTSLQPAKTAEVHCERAFFLVGAISCAPTP